jgi:DNA-3-methyladenine glycosylase II
MRAPLTDRGLAHGARAIARVDRDLASVLARHGTPPRWAREPGFATLVQIILEQQVSLASGRAAFARVLSVAGEMTPARVAKLSERQLRAAGLTRQKAAYVRGLARSIVSGHFDIDAVGKLEDDAARAELIKLKGIGPWSADIYLLMALGRRDVWPRHDLALASAMRDVKRLRSLPTPERQLEIAEAWRPWRAVAARLMWHHYLSRASATRGRAPQPRRTEPARPSARAAHADARSRRPSRTDVGP